MNIKNIDSSSSEDESYDPNKVVEEDEEVNFSNQPSQSESEEVIKPKLEKTTKKEKQ